MITITKGMYIPSVDETLGILTKHNSMMPQFLDYDKLQTYLGYCTIKASRMKGPLFDAVGLREFDEMGIANAFKLWIERNEITSLFKATKTGISVDQDSVDQAKASGKLTQEQIKIIDWYQEYTKYVRYARVCMGLLQNTIVGAKSYDGHRMIRVNPIWHPQNTGRVAMRDPAIQNLPREFHDLQTVPEGWTLIHTDSGQIEPRIIYSAFIPDPQIQALINLYDDAYFGVLHYVTMDKSIIASGTTNFVKNELTDAQKEMRKEIKTYQNAVMYGSTSNSKASSVKQALIDRIGNHPMRHAWLSRNDKMLEQGITVFKTAFGTPIDVSNSQKLDDGLSQDDQSYEYVKLAINNPIQGTAADLMRVSVSEANRILSRDAKNSFIISYLHDAGLFAVHHSDYDKVADRLSDIVSYDVEGWLPIKAEPVIGRDPGWFEDWF